MMYHPKKSHKINLSKMSAEMTRLEVICDKILYKKLHSEIIVLNTCVTRYIIVLKIPYTKFSVLQYWRKYIAHYYF